MNAPVPRGWVVLPAPPSFYARNAAPDVDWSVRVEGSNVKALPWSPPAPTGETLPFEPPYEFGASGTRRVKRVTDGFIVGYNNGEFGGGLWWYSATGERSEQLIGENVAGMSDSPIGTLVFTGLDHLGLSQGALYLIREQEGHRVQKLAKLGTQPLGIMALSRSLIFATTRFGVFKIVPFGRIVVLMHGELSDLVLSGVHIKPPRMCTPEMDFTPLSPVSIAVTLDGVVFIGFKWFVARLTPEPKRYRVDWLAPAA
jgi:hypothetical protein